VPLARKKIEFLPEKGGFWCILGLLFTFIQKLVRSMGAGALPAPLNPPLILLLLLLLGVLACVVRWTHATM